MATALGGAAVGEMSLFTAREASRGRASWWVRPCWGLRHRAISGHMKAVLLTAKTTKRCPGSARAHRTCWSGGRESPGRRESPRGRVGPGLPEPPGAGEPPGGGESPSGRPRWPGLSELERRLAWRWGPKLSLVLFTSVQLKKILKRHLNSLARLVYWQCYQPLFAPFSAVFKKFPHFGAFVR